ncbi:hypothetical protein BpHYR1_009362 [Brachionus plicatilis]|uniref:Uncharacterized protein n=1 Tax=Brachionus plicatilis TaxID=10195 RepID=A0A3M7RL81_BRAPC|nr:hypothetical protein BpHYR1_009362 [Brachionus plicatilis]
MNIENPFFVNDVDIQNYFNTIPLRCHSVLMLLTGSFLMDLSPFGRRFPLFFVPKTFSGLQHDPLCPNLDLSNQTYNFTEIPIAAFTSLLPLVRLVDNNILFNLNNYKHYRLFNENIMYYDCVSYHIFTLSFNTLSDTSVAGSFQIVWRISLPSKRFKKEKIIIMNNKTKLICKFCPKTYISRGCVISYSNISTNNINVYLGLLSNMF